MGEPDTVTPNTSLFIAARTVLSTGVLAAALLTTPARAFASSSPSSEGSGMPAVAILSTAEAITLLPGGNTLLTGAPAEAHGVPPSLTRMPPMPAGATLFGSVLAGPLAVSPAALGSSSYVSPRAVAVDVQAAQQRPRLLMPLYASFVGLEVLDAATTLSRLSAGAREGNPIVGSVSGSPAAVVALKAGGAVASLFLTERLAKTNPLAAKVLMVTLNAVYAGVVANNLSR